MELKKYQSAVIKDLQDYLEVRRNSGENCNLSAVWAEYWKEKGKPEGVAGIAGYNDSIAGVPHICMKVPTGGGKTFLACCAVKKIFDGIADWTKPRVVVWLVPSDAILEQTVRNLKNPDHPYRQRLNRDSMGKVEVYTKDELLFAQNFSPDSVKSNLTIAVMSYASVRIDKTKKDSRKVYQENGNLMRFAQFFKDKEALLADTPETALIQVLRYFNPVVIVDESHNAVADLSVEMIRNLNPSFVLDLTATPRDNSNIVSYVTPYALKVENMVKLPVVVYGCNSRPSVIENALILRKSFEEQANEERAVTGKYIRPIVLFQAQPNTGANSATFESVKQQLIEAGIPKEQIAIKTAQINELKNVDLLSEKCEIRYIITINALKEGWDCPFAYILASLANRTSPIDVEQILGRILRKPYTRQYEHQLLNSSFVLTNSNDFYGALAQIVKALNGCGFGENDYISGKTDDIKPTEGTQETLFRVSEPAEAENGQSANGTDEELNNMQLGDMRDVLNGTTKNSGKDDVLLKVKEMQENYENRAKAANGADGQGNGVDFKNLATVNEEFEREIEGLKLPVFYNAVTDTRLCGNNMQFLTKEQLSDNFRLCDLSTRINFESIDSQIYSVDVEAGTKGAQYRETRSETKNLLREQLAHLTPEAQLARCENLLFDKLNKEDRYDAVDVRRFVKRVIEDMDENNLAKLKDDTFHYADALKTYVEAQEKQHRYNEFFKRIDSGKIQISEDYPLQKSFTLEASQSYIQKSLYTMEKDDMNSVETEVLNRILANLNIIWWHRIIDTRNSQDFHINGFINHYPDFIIKTAKGKILLIEVKGSQLDNSSDTIRKLELGKKWADVAGDKYRYFMIFKDIDIGRDGAYRLDDFLQKMKEI